MSFCYERSNWNSADGEAGVKKLLLGWWIGVLTQGHLTHFVSGWLKAVYVDAGAIGCFVVTGA